MTGCTAGVVDFRTTKSENRFLICSLVLVSLNVARALSRHRIRSLDEMRERLLGLWALQRKISEWRTTIVCQIGSGYVTLGTIVLIMICYAYRGREAPDSLGFAQMKTQAKSKIVSLPSAMAPQKRKAQAQSSKITKTTQTGKQLPNPRAAAILEIDAYPLLSQLPPRALLRKFRRLRSKPPP